MCVLCQSAALPAWMLLVHHFQVGAEVSFWRLAGCCFVFCSLKGKKSVFRVPAFIARRGSSTKSSRLNMETFLSSSHTAFVSPLVPPQNRLSGYSVSGNARLQHVAQMDALRSRSSWRQLLWRPSPWGLLFFSWVAVGSQRQGNCMNSEKGEVNTSFPWLRKMKKKKKWQQPWTAVSKNIYFSLQTLRRGLPERGEGGRTP